MAFYRIGVLLGDDIGLEVVPVAVEVLKTAIAPYPDIQVEWVELPVGLSAFRTFGSSLPAQTVDILPTLDGFILGPIGHMAYPKDINCFPPHMVLRRDLDLISNIRPAKAYPMVPSLHQGVDLVIVRENTQGFQPDRNMFAGNSECMPTPDLALSTRVITRRNSMLAARAAFQLARQRNKKKKVTVIHKNTVFKLGCGLFVDCAQEVAKEFPDIEIETCVVDTFAMKMVMRPQDYDVVLASNLFGDILSDEAAGIVGGLGMAPGLNLGPRYRMANATHGSAPDIAGKNIANPFAMILSAQLLFSWLAHEKQDDSAIQAAQAVEAAAEAVLGDKAVVTPDLGGTGGTLQMGEAICRILEDQRNF